jgi:hypothetical protein
MGKTYTPAYVVVVDGNEAQAMEWRTRNRSGNPAHGAVTPEALERWVIAYGKSFEPGQCNAHISNALGAHSVPVPGLHPPQRCRGSRFGAVDGSRVHGVVRVNPYSHSPTGC